MSITAAYSAEQLFAEMSDNWTNAPDFDPFAMYAERRRNSPVMEGDLLAELGLPSIATGDGTRPGYTMYRYADVAASLRDAQTFANSHMMPLFEPLAGRIILGMDGEEHRAWRSALTPVFTRKAVVDWTKDIVVPTARESVGRLREQSEKRADLVEFAHHFPMRIIYEVIGLPVDEESYARFQLLAVMSLLALAPQTDPAKADLALANFQRAVEAGEELRDMIAPIVAARRAEGADGKDLISTMIRAPFEGGGLSDTQITDFLRGLLQAATDNTTRMFLNTVALLLRRPELLEAVRSDRSLLNPLAIEAERFDGPIGVLTRLVTRDTTVGGVSIPAGAGVSLVVNSANRDEEAFTDPDVFRLHRKEATPLTWGLGRHVCSGMNIARSETTVTLDALLDALPNLRLDPDVPEPEIVGLHARAPHRLRVVWD